MDKFVDIIKDIEEISGISDMGYSRMNGNSYDMRGRSGRMSFNRGYSYGRNNGYSRGDNKEEMLDHLQNVADMAIDEKDRKAIEKLMMQMSER